MKKNNNTASRIFLAIFFGLWAGIIFGIIFNNFFIPFIIAFTITLIKVHPIESDNQTTVITNPGYKVDAAGRLVPDGTSTTTTAETKAAEVVVEPVIEAKTDPLFDKNIDQIIVEVVKKEMEKHSVNTKCFSAIEKSKTISRIVFGLICFLLITLYFFHVNNTLVVFLLIVNVIVYIVMVKKFSIYKYIKKQLEARPDEDMSNVIGSVILDQAPIKYRLISFLVIVFSIASPFYIFNQPRLLFEHVDGGYRLRYATIGLSNNKKFVVPDTYKGEKVVGVRGQVFANMKELEEVVLPNTITEIRGQAFKNDYNLVKVNIPTSLTYLGGSAFSGCSSLDGIILPEGLEEIGGETFKDMSSLKEINIPSTVRNIGGEAFSGCSSLREIVLPSNITEVHGNTFENCTSLKTINIPDSVYRIGGHAFYGCSSLEKVTITRYSQLKEIGSSAFRECYSLHSIILPRGVSINERAFKSSPTNIYYYDSNGQVVSSYGKTVSEDEIFSQNDQLTTDGGQVYYYESNDINFYDRLLVPGGLNG